MCRHGVSEMATLRQRRVLSVYVIAVDAATGTRKSRSAFRNDTINVLLVDRDN
jgi:hypothetical protein